MPELIYPQCRDGLCPLSDSCSRTATRVDVSPFKKVEDPVDVLFIGDCASAREWSAKSAFHGPEQSIISSIINKVMPDKSIAYTYLVRGWPVNMSTVRDRDLENADLRWVKTYGLSSYPKRTEVIKKCQPYLLADIARLKPKKIIVMGSTVKEALFPREQKTISRLLNSFRVFQGIQTRFIYSPTTLVRSPSGRRTWENQLAACLTGQVNKRDDKIGEVELLTDLQDCLDYIEALKENHSDVSIDIETLNLNKKYGNRIATLQFSETTESGVVIPYNHPDSPFNPDEIKILKAALFDLFHNPSNIKHWVGHNLKFECNVLHAVIGTPLLSAPLYDTQIGAFLLDENRRERAAEFEYGIYTLKQLALDCLNYDGYDKGVLKERAAGNLFDLNLEDLARYGAMDTYISLRLMKFQLKEARDQNYYDKLTNLMYYLYTPMTLMFSDIEQNGFSVNKKDLRFLISKKSPLLTAIRDIEEQFKTIPEVKQANDLLLRQQAGGIIPLGRKPWIFDLAKQGHPQTLFIDVCKLAGGKIGKSGKASVDKNWQNKHKDHPLVASFIEWQAMRTLYNTFAIKLYDRIDPQTGHPDSKEDSRIRCSYLLTRAVTGRVACEDPNLQQIPRSDTEAKKAIKNIFQATKGHIMVQLDYKANEMRWAGILAQDDNLAEAIKNGKKMMDEYRRAPSKELLERAATYGDIHRQVASGVFGKDLNEINKDERQAAKAVGFGILFGSGTKAIAEKHNKPVDVVQGWFDDFYNRYPGIATWKERMESNAKNYGYIEAAHGRRRRFPIFEMFRNESGYYDESLVPEGEVSGKIAECLRQAVNSPIQGVASDYGMCGAALFADYIRKHNKPWTILNAVHDSCVFEVPFDQLEESLVQAEESFTTEVMDYMAAVFDINFNLPLEVDFELGLKWGDLKGWNFDLTELEELKKEFRSQAV